MRDAGWKRFFASCSPGKEGGGASKDFTFMLRASFF
jgi:hypothetical protein